MNNEAQKIKNYGIEISAGIAAGVALFFFLTSGIPLMQLGLMRDWGPGKKKYLNAARWAIAGLGLLLVFLRWKLPWVFESLWLTRAARWVLRLPLGFTAAVLFILYFFSLSWVVCLRQMALETRAFDMGIFSQAVWTTLHGHFIFSSLKGDICLLGDHVSPLLAALVIPYAIWSDPRVLLILQAMAAAGCIFPLVRLVEAQFEDKKTALVFALMYFFYMPTRAAVHEDFHPEVLIKPVLFFAFLWLEQGRRRLFLFALAVILSAKENMAGVTFAFGFYALVFKKERGMGMAVMAISAAYLVFCVRWLVPHLSGQTYLYGGFYAHLAQNGTAGIGALLADKERWEYVLKVYGPFLLLPFFDFPTLLLTLPVLFQNLLSVNPVVRSFGYHYTTGQTAFLFIGTMTALFKIRSRYAWAKKYFDVLLAVLLWVSLLRAGAPEYFYGWQSAKNVTPRTQMIRKKLAAIPAEERVLTHNNLIPQLANRMGVYQFNYNPTSTKSGDALKYRADAVILDRNFMEPGTGGLETGVRDLKAAGYRLDFEKDGFYILKHAKIHPS